MNCKTILTRTTSLLLIVIILTACSNTPIPTPTLRPTITPTVVPPTPEPIVIPEARGYHLMAYDNESKRVIMFGGQTGDPMQKDGWSNETWSFDPKNQLWKKMSPNIAPDGFSGDMTYNSKNDRVILVLNTDPATPNFFDYKKSQTWAYDFNTDTWTQLEDGPSGRLGARVAYDSESEKIILFGGFTLITGQAFNETWAYDFDTNTWAQMQPSLSPVAQNYQCMAYDSKADRVVNWGGENKGSLWTYDYNTDTWEEIKTELKPSEQKPRAFFYCGFTYSNKDDLFILYGGSDLGSDQTWTYNLNSKTWQKIEPSQNPGKLSRHTLVYDPDTDRAILFGGQIGGSQFSYSAKTWLYDLHTNTWKEVITEE